MSQSKSSSSSGTQSSRIDFRSDYKVTGSGVNSEGNKWTTRDYGASAPNQNPYHYSNSDGSYYYKNPDGSDYYNNGNGFARYNDGNGGGFTEFSR